MPILFGRKRESSDPKAGKYTFNVNRQGPFDGLARDLNFENIPLFQTLGHCEYVLRHESYARLRENGCIDQYCPSNPEVLPFLEQWIDEYWEVFDSPRLFHVGADETMQLGVCHRCKAYAATHGVSGLYRNHMDRIIEMVAARGARPLLWADMFLSHPESLAGLTRDLTLCDWAYGRDDNATGVFLFCHGSFPVERVPPSAVEAFGELLFRPGSNRSQLNPWVAADHLASLGFDLLLCSASSSWGDAVFAPRTGLHLSNIGDTVRHAAKLGAGGTILTSWTCHLFPWDLQRPLMAYGMAVANGGHPAHDAFLDDYGRDRLGMADESFAQICALLESPCPLTNLDQLGFYKGCIKCHSGGLDEFLAGCDLAAMTTQADAAASACGKAKAILDAQPGGRIGSNREMDAWKLAADCLAIRARSARYLFTRQAGGSPSEDPRELAALESRQRTRSLDAFMQKILPHRAEDMVSCQFDDVIDALRK